jgi:polyphenol oxidase
MGNELKMFTLSSKGPVQYIRSEMIDSCGFVTHAFLTRWGGVSAGVFSDLNVSVRQGDLEAHVEQNFEIVSAQFHLQQFFLMHQIHSDRILVLNGEEKTADNITPQADAVIIKTEGLAIGIKTADCVPILIVDPVKRIIGAVHAGWRGTALQIAFKTIEGFVSAFSSNPADLIAAIGPCIGACCYEVDRVVYEAMSQEDRDIGFRAKGEEKWMLDLAAMNRKQLIRAGLDPNRVSSINLCTVCRADLFFSHRRDGGVTGRQLNFISLKST